MGFPLHNRGALFALEANDPDALAPRKRPFHTIIPAFMERGDIHIVFGIMGGSNQPLAHAQLASNFVDYGMNIQAALDAPRFTIPDTGTRAIGCDILVESRVAPDVLKQLRQKGHRLRVRKEYSATMGRGQAVLHDSKRRVNFGASDPRGRLGRTRTDSVGAGCSFSRRDKPWVTVTIIFAQQLSPRCLRFSDSPLARVRRPVTSRLRNRKRLERSPLSGSMRPKRRSSMRSRAFE